MVINQFRGIGDIIFLEPLIREMHKRGQTVFVPVDDLSIGDYIPSGHFVQKEQFKLDYESMDFDNPDYFPARFANQIIRESNPDDHRDLKNMMLDKYSLANIMYGDISPNLWLTITLKRNPAKEEDLYKELGEPENFHLINQNYAGGKKAKISPNLGKAKRVHMKNIPGYSLVDWCGIMEKAKSNHHVSTSTFYLMQFLKLKNCFIYPRNKEEGLEGIKELAKVCEFDCNLVES